MRCIDCGLSVDPNEAVRLTETSAMCHDCHREAVEAWLAELAMAWVHYCPGPAELQRRKEKLRASIGSKPREDLHRIGETVVGTFLYEFQQRRSESPRKKRRSRD